jgi:hypothetical protein
MGQGHYQWVIQEYVELLPHSAKSSMARYNKRSGFLVIKLRKQVNKRIVKCGTLDIQHGTKIHETDRILLQIR